MSSRNVVFVRKTRTVNESVYDPERQDASEGFRSGDEEERETELTVREARGGSGRRR